MGLAVVIALALLNNYKYYNGNDYKNEKNCNENPYPSVIGNCGRNWSICGLCDCIYGEVSSIEYYVVTLTRTLHILKFSVLVNVNDLHYVVCNITEMCGNKKLDSEAIVNRLVDAILCKVDIVSRANVTYLAFTEDIIRAEVIILRGNILHINTIQLKYTAESLNVKDYGAGRILYGMILNESKDSESCGHIRNLIIVFVRDFKAYSHGIRAGIYKSASTVRFGYALGKSAGDLKRVSLAVKYDGLVKELNTAHIVACLLDLPIVLVLVAKEFVVIGINKLDLCNVLTCIDCLIGVVFVNNVSDTVGKSIALGINESHRMNLAVVNDISRLPIVLGKINGCLFNLPLVVLHRAVYVEVIGVDNYRCNVRACESCGVRIGAVVKICNAKLKHVALGILKEYRLSLSAVNQLGGLPGIKSKIKVSLGDCNRTLIGRNISDGVAVLIKSYNTVVRTAVSNVLNGYAGKNSALNSLSVLIPLVRRS